MLPVTLFSRGQVGWMSRLVDGEGGNGLPQWSQSRPYNHIYISRKRRPVGGELIPGPGTRLGHDVEAGLRS